MRTIPCPVCGAQMRVATEWVKRRPRVITQDGEEVLDLEGHAETRMVSAQCPRDHWYGGPAKDVEVNE
jgi:hypothetical protein